MRPARLIPLLLGAGLVVPLTWGLVRSDDAVRSAWAQSPVRRGAGDAEARPTDVLAMPIAGVDPRALRDSFREARGGGRSHAALDIPAPRGTPVLAVGDGVVRKLFTSGRGGLTVYEFDPPERYCYYYAHLHAYAASLHEGQRLRRGDVIGYVGSTGNAREDAPHLHFAVTRLDADKRWWGGTPVDPYPFLVREP